MILELSTKCVPSEAFQVAVETRTFLTKKGVELTGEQQTKTKQALEYFSERLQADRDYGANWGRDREASSDRRAPPLRGIDGERASDTGHAVGHVREAVA